MCHIVSVIPTVTSQRYNEGLRMLVVVACSVDLSSRHTI